MIPLTTGGYTPLFSPPKTRLFTTRGLNGCLIAATPNQNKLATCCPPLHPRPLLPALHGHCIVRTSAVATARPSMGNFHSNSLNELVTLLHSVTWFRKLFKNVLEIVYMQSHNFWIKKYNFNIVLGASVILCPQKYFLSSYSIKKKCIFSFIKFRLNLIATQSVAS